MIAALIAEYDELQATGYARHAEMMAESEHEPFYNYSEADELLADLNQQSKELLDRIVAALKEGTS